MFALMVVRSMMVSEEVEAATTMKKMSNFRLFHLSLKTTRRLIVPNG